MLKYCCLFFLLASVLCGAEPFRWKAESSGGKLTVSVKVASGYYLTLDSILTEISDGEGKLPPIISKPPRSRINDPEQGNIYILPEGSWQWIYGGVPPYRVKVAFQGCRKGGPGEAALCLMPQELQLLPSGTPMAAAEKKAVSEFYGSWQVIRQHSGMMQKDEMTAFLKGGSPAAAEKSRNTGRGFWLMALLALLGGLGLNLTPCVLPMIPINLAVIGARESRKAGFRRGLLYGCGMAAAYGILGAAVIYSGGTLGALNSSPYFNLGIGILFAVLAAAMAGVFNFDLSGILRISPGKLNVGREAGAFIMGGVSALLAGACVAPVVAGVLLFAAGLYADGNQLAPFMGVLLGVGMGLPWPFAGMGLAVLPKPGKFMVWVKYSFALLIMLGAVYYFFMAWSLRPGNYSPAAELARLEEAGSRARREGKLLVVDFTASWCKNCHEMKRNVLPEPEVKEQLKKFVFIEFHAEKPGDPLIAPLLKKWNIPGFPSFVILRP